MKAPSCHVGLDRLRADPKATAKLLKDLGVEMAFAPAPPPNEREKDAEGWRALGRELAEIGRVVTGEGLTFGWHNHHWEFFKTAGGETPLDLMFHEAPGVAWEAVGCAQGAYEHALRYATERQQFGRPIAQFQLVQDLLVRMLGNVTAAKCLVARLSQMQDAGWMDEEHASLAKAFCTMRMRETVGWARELMGGNGILLDHDVGRFVADAEAIYSYEGTREINALVVGRAITGLSAFV